MANSISHAALPFPVKNARYTVLVPYLDADGDPTDPTTPDTEVSQDGGAFADAAEEVSTITGTNGAGFVTLSGAETNNSAVFVAFKVASGPKATLMTLYPRVLPIVESGTAQAGAAGTITLASGAAAYDLAGCIVRTTGGTGGGGTGGANNQARVITAYNTSTKVATVVPNWETTPDATTTYDVLYTDLSVNAIAGRFVRPATDGRTLVVDAAGLADANAVKVGPTGAGTAQTAGDLKASLNTIDDFIDTEVAAILADTDDIQTRLPAALVGGRMDASVGAMAANVLTAAAVADAAFDRATFAEDTGLQTIRSNTAQAGAAGTITLDIAAQTTDDFYNGLLVTLTGGTGVGQNRIIYDYVGATRVASITPNWVTNPDATTGFAVLQFGSVSVEAWLRAVPNALVAGRTDASVGAVAAGVDLSATMKASVNTEVVDALNVDTYAEPGQEVPPATTTLVKKIGYLFKACRNKFTDDGTTAKLFNDGGLTVDQKATVSDDGVTYTRGEFGTGP